MMRRRRAELRRSRGVAAAVTVLGAIANPGTAHADPAEPTDFRTEVVAVTPSTDAIAVTIEGGDSFVRVAADRGVEVVVLGYDGEPYVLIDSAGDVFENARSYATYYNATRDGASAAPPSVDNAAEPDWAQVGSGGAWAWHDHRAHWMGGSPPIGMRPGDSLPVATIPLLVDGKPVEVAVVSSLVGGPSWWPSALAGLGVVAVTAVAVRRRWPTSVALGALACSAIALAIGAAQFLALPAETGPRPIWWLAPATALGCAAAALALRRHRFMALGLVATSAAQLVVWTLIRRLTFVRPVLPTDLPAWLDRSASAAVAAGAIVVLAATATRIAGVWRQAPSASSIAATSAS
jgi:hypothetical protein